MQDSVSLRIERELASLHGQLSLDPVLIIHVAGLLECFIYFVNVKYIQTHLQNMRSKLHVFISKKCSMMLEVGTWQELKIPIM